MRTTLLLVFLCVLPDLDTCQTQKGWSKAPSRHRDKTEKGKYEADFDKVKEELLYPREPMRGLDRRFSNGSADGSVPFRNDRAIDRSSSTEKNHSTNSTNLPKSGAKPRERFREKGRRFKNVTIGDGICQSIDIRNNAIYLEILKDCRVIEGFLQIVLMDSTTEVDFQNVSFPKLREITGYLLIYRVNGLKSLGNLLPNLEIIRGGVLLTDYAFMIYEMQNLQEIGLGRLRKISRGGVRLEKNPKLCYTTSIDWNAIVEAGDTVIKENEQESTCPGCSQCPDGHCWTAKVCQSTDKPKCHPQCFGQCDGPTDHDCHVCKNYRYQAKCIERCPPNLYAYLSRRCITKEECLRMNNLRRITRLEDDQRWRPFNGSCMTQCPDGFEDHVDENNVTTCRLCEGRCRKVVKGANIRHISDAQIFRGTTVVNGALEFQIRNGNPNIMNELTDAFGTIEEITEYVKITHSSPITSLSFFKKLKVIRGEKLDINNASLVVLDNPNLSNLFGHDQKIEIQNGRLFFHYNPKLCFSKIEQLGRMVGITNLTNVEVQPESNGEKVACDIVNINIRVRELGSHYADLVWSGYDTPRGQTLLSYLLNYIATENENVSYEVNSCGGNNTWQIVDVDASNINVDSSTVSKHIVGLKPYTKYAVYVKTFSARDEHAYSSAIGQSKIIFFRTKSDVPSLPATVLAHPLSDSEVLVEWEPPEEPNGPIGYYIISGFIRSEDRELVLMRDYCESPLNGLEDEGEQEMRDSTTTTTKAPPEASTSAESCACEKNENMRPKPFATRIFENFCRENASVDAVSNFPSLEWKDQCVFNRYNSPISQTSKAVEPVLPWIPDDENVKITDDGRTRIYRDVYYSFVFNVSAQNGSSFLLKNLYHYSLYTISVAACGVKLSDNDAEMCSSVQYTSARTKRRENADDVINVRTRVTNNTIVEVFWDAVKNPNALTVAYTIEYTNLDVKDAKKTSDCIPAMAVSKDRVKRHGYTIKNLSPGRYGLRMRSTSLAGDGNFSKTIVFSVGLKEDNTTLVVSLLVLGIFGVALIIAFLTWRNHRKRKREERLIASVNPDYIETKYIIDGWEVPRENVEILEELGLGNFGMVYRGRLDNEIQVAIKTISDKASEREKNEFLNEASVMKNFSTFHIVKLLGVVSIGNPPFVIMELMENGDLKTYLRRIRDTRLVPDASRIMRMAAEIADGMAYLESKKFVHRDLAARNCMVSEDLVCKIGDFGMARDIYETDYYKVGKKGLLPIRWMAPENLSDGVFTSDSDVWSFGVVLYEILTLAEIPYQGFSNEEVLHYVLHKGMLATPRHAPENISKIMEKCFKWRPSDRPTFMEIVADLEPFLGQDFCDKSFYHSEEGIEIRNSGIKKVYHHAAPIRFHWGNETARWVKEFEDNVTLLDQTKAGTSRGRIFKNGFQSFGSVSNNAEETPLDR